MDGRTSESGQDLEQRTPRTSRPDASPILQAEGVTKLYRSVVALKDVTISASPGRVHALFGEDGSGKTTLVKILSGELRPDAGRLLVDGKESLFTKPADAHRLGISATCQERNLMMDLNVMQNVFVRGLPCRRTPFPRMVNWSQAAQDTAAILGFLGVDIDPHRKVATLSLAEQQFVEIAKALSNNPRLLILDEPVSTLSEAESERVFEAIRRLSIKGVTVVYASHQLEDLSHVVIDQVTVLKSGRSLGTLPASAVSRRSIMEMMMAEASQAAALREADRLRYEFVSLVSHELRTPLAAIKGHATTLLRHQWPESIQRECLTTVDEECDRLKELIDNILDISRIERGDLHIAREPILLSAVIHKVVDQIRDEKSGHTLLVELPPGLPFVYADPRRVKQVLENLVENAVKYSPAGGVINVVVQCEQGEVHVLVKDQGVGIAPEHHERIFERFYRVPNPAVGNVGGSGLGLAICKGIVEAHGGRIWVLSSPARGSTFGFSFPVCTSSDESIGARESRS